MTLMCIDRSQSPTHKGSFLQGRKSPVNSNINQQNANHHHHRKSSCSPPLSGKNSPESRKLERSSSDPDKRSAIAQQSNSSRYKTELCRPFEESGTCKYGDKCQFAHGVKELRSMARHPKYKTELCRTFHSTGLCPYGPRCHFIHNSEQFKKSLLTHLTSNTQPQQQQSRQEPLSSVGSAGEITPPSSTEVSPTDEKCFDDLYHQPPAPLSPPDVCPISQALVNINHPNFDFVPVDCFPDNSAFNFDNALNNVLDNYGFVGNFVSDFPILNNQASDEGIYLRLPFFDRMQIK